jgi:hypothetical protein
VAKCGLGRSISRRALPLSRHGCPPRGVTDHPTRKRYAALPGRRTPVSSMPCLAANKVAQRKKADSRSARVLSRSKTTRRSLPGVPLEAPNPPTWPSTAAPLSGRNLPTRETATVKEEQKAGVRLVTQSPSTEDEPRPLADAA